MSARDYEDAAPLSATERRLVGLCERINENPGAKNLQTRFHKLVSRRWIALCTSNLLEVRGLAHARDLESSNGVLVCSNHRSFFDMYVLFAVLRNERLPWLRDVYFPVRSTFFYEQWAGLAVNLLMGGGAMYPPIFRDPDRAVALNKVSVERIVRFLRTPGVAVGMHPEGTRGKGPDPYDLLPAQPGVGQMAVQGGAPVLPVWVNGLSNDMPRQILSNFRSGANRGERIVVSIGAPVDLGDLRAERARLTVYKRAADRILDAIRALGERERARDSAGDGNGA